VTPLERAVMDEMVRLNKPITSDDDPYPISLLPIVRAVIETVKGFKE
jgi:hypothetical protein